MDFKAPDPARYRISECGKWIVEKIQYKNGAVYTVWEFKQVVYGLESMQDAVDSIKNRQTESLKARVEFVRCDSASNAAPPSELVSNPRSAALALRDALKAQTTSNGPLSTEPYPVYPPSRPHAEDEDIPG